MKRKRIVYVFGIICIGMLTACGKHSGKEDTVTPGITNGAEMSEESPKQDTTKAPDVTKASISVGKKEEPVSVVDVVKGEAWDLGNLQGNLLNEGWVCESEGKLYYRDFNHDNFLCKMNPDGSEKQVLADEIPRAIQVVGNWVYYIDDEKDGKLRGRIKRVSKDGGEVTVIGEDKAGYILVTEEGIFYSSRDIMKMNLDGSGRTVVQEYTGKADYAWLSIFGDCVFTEDVLSGKQLYAVKLDGSGQYLLGEGVMYPTVSGTSLWFSGKKGEFTELSLVTGEKTVWDGTYVMRSVQYKNAVYYHNSYAIYAIKEGDKAVEKLYPNDPEGKHFIDLFWVAADKIYFCDYLTEKDATLTFQYMDLETGELGIVP